MKDNGRSRTELHWVQNGLQNRSTPRAVKHTRTSFSEKQVQRGRASTRDPLYNDFHLPATVSLPG